MTDAERQARKEQYQEMMKLSAWKDFMASIDRVHDDAVKDEDAIDTCDMNIAKIAECRGMRKAVRVIKSNLDWIVNGTI